MLNALERERKSWSRTSKEESSSIANRARLMAYSAKWCARLIPNSRRWRRVSRDIARAEARVTSDGLYFPVEDSLSGVWGPAEGPAVGVSSSSTVDELQRLITIVW